MLQQRRRQLSRALSSFIILVACLLFGTVAFAQWDVKTDNVRIANEFPLSWANAFADSTAENDSLTVEITTYTPIGDGQGLFIQNSEGVDETVELRIDTFLNNPIAKIDSIKVPIWTETTDGTDYIAFRVYDDSTTTRFRAKPNAVANDSVSSTARTTRTVKMTPTIVGGRFRIRGTILTKSDSAFVGAPIVYTTNR